MKVRQDIKQHVTNNRGNPGQLISDKLTQHPVGVRVAAGKTDTIKRAVRRLKRGNTPPEPTSINDIPELPEAFETTGGPDKLPFLIYDNYVEGQSNDGRVIVFATELGLKHLCDSSHWFVDGTFGTAPRQFTQLFVIRAEVNDVTLTCVYAFLPDKQQSSYEEVFIAVLNACDAVQLTPDPAVLTCDFELGIHGAVASMLGCHVRIQGCFYHLTQCTWRRVQSEGLSTLYKEDDEVKQYCGMLDGLAFLPPSRVQDGMRYLKTVTPPALEDLTEYFDTNFVSGPYKSVMGARGRITLQRTSPKYAIDKWNVNQVTLEDGSRTNNKCEAWNNSFSHLVGHKNPGLWHTIQCIQKDQLNVITEVERVRQGAPTRKRVRRETRNLQDRLKQLCQDFDAGEKDVRDFLRAVGHSVRFV